MKKKILNATSFVLLMVGMLTGLGSDCDGGSKEPDAVEGVFTTNVFPYVCNNGSPAFLVENGPNGGGNLIVDVTGSTLPAFKRNKVNTFFNNTIDCGNVGTCCVSQEFPKTGGYTVTLWYTELGSSNCPPPGPSMCYRWFKQETFAAGFKPTCSNAITINVMDPNGFSGPCN